MAGEIYRAADVRLVLTLAYPELEEAMIRAGATPDEIYAVASRVTAEPAHLTQAESGDAAPPVLLLDVASYQGNQGLNQIPEAVCTLGVGQDGSSVLPPPLNVSVVHVLEKYWTGEQRAKVFLYVNESAGAGTPDAGHILNDFVPGEAVLLFDGFVTSVNRSGSAANYQFDLRLTSFLSALNYSSSVSASVAPGSSAALAFNSRLSPHLQAGTGFSTMFGPAQLAMGASDAVNTDFWGYWLPAGVNRPSRASDFWGLQHFFYALCAQDLFAWAALTNAQGGATRCTTPEAAVRRNQAALTALQRIEPFSRLDPVDENDRSVIRSGWQAMTTSVRNLTAAATAVGDIDAGYNRRSLILSLGARYYQLGFRYGMPLSARAQLGSSGYGLGRSVAEDLAAENFTTLGPATIWDKLVGQYASRFLFALAPMADRAVIMAIEPGLKRVWQTVYASEVDHWEDSFNTPRRIRGVVLTGDRRSVAGVFAGGNRQAPSARGFDLGTAVYDSCVPGTLIFREAPAWVSNAQLNPAGYANLSMSRPRPAANAPTTSPQAADAIDAATRTAAQGAGLATTAPAAPSSRHQSLMYAYARALYRQEVTRYRSVYFSGRLRIDIGPGSTIDVEAPRDRAVASLLREPTYPMYRGVVLRVTIVIDAENRRAGTGFMLGYVRSPSEAESGPLSADGHPVWSGTTYGIPAAENSVVRQALGERDVINVAESQTDD